MPMNILCKAFIAFSVISVSLQTVQATRPSGGYKARLQRAGQIQSNDSQSAVASAPTATQQALKKEFEIPIRVLLEEKKDAKREQWLVESAHGCTISSIGTERKSILTNKQIHITFTNGCFTVNGKKQSCKTLFIKSASPGGLLTYKGNRYKGALALIMLGSTLYLVNHIDLEDYVVCVLPSESWPGWPEEFNRAFCIVVRTYALAKILEERHIRAKRNSHLPYDIRCTNVHQTYHGYKECAQMELYKKVAQDTKGIVLTYQEKPGSHKVILAMFDCSCGGAIPSKIEGVDFYKAPYLARSYPCNYCKDYKLTNWTKTHTLKDLCHMVKKEYPKLQAIRDITITKKDRAGMVTEMKVRGNSLLTLAGKKITAIIKGLKSRRFTIEKKGATVTFKGVGYGHCLGLCQWGARKMVELNWPYKKILEFFFKDIHFMKIKPAK